ncbi:DUF3304 domain-containing protein [Janthinobacterium sp. HSC-3S05]|uniref:DUF3304 domain-containing protein n=1 Tax=Janthinobacterium lividum TaxID=29581 RepID=UPI001CD87353|nr:DUF3304 domain-containing protein [Janthinobacterium lividum]MCA1861055.1 DUF3304 domain-containing protein [Janthinobacterium lividum]
MKHPRVDSPQFSIAVYDSKVEKQRGIFCKVKTMKWMIYLGTALLLSGCGIKARQVEQAGPSPTATAQVGIVNHTGKYIYSASVDGAGGGNMARWGVGGANICCTSIPRVWHPGMNVLVRWNMPEGHTDVIKEKMVEIEKYDRPGDIYMHFFENDEVRVVVSNDAGYGKDHPIQHTANPSTKK